MFVVVSDSLDEVSQVLQRRDGFDEFVKPLAMMRLHFSDPLDICRVLFSKDSQTPDFRIQRIEPLIDLHEPLIDLHEPLIDLCEPLIDLCEPLINLCEPLINLCEPLINLREPFIDLLPDGVEALFHPSKSFVYVWHRDPPRAKR